MVKTMLRILQKEGRTEAYWKTVDKYQFLPDIMKIRFDWLATKKDWSAILAMLDRSGNRRAMMAELRRISGK